jgi:hypothetical protein
VIGQGKFDARGGVLIGAPRLRIRTPLLELRSNLTSLTRSLLLRLKIVINHDRSPCCSLALAIVIWQAPRPPATQG